MIRQAKPGDIKRVCEIERQSFDDPWPEADFLYYLEGESEKFLVWDSGIVNGYIIFSLIGREAEVYDIAVAPGARGAGVGKALIGAMLDQADAAFLEVRDGNVPAMALYQSYGFVIDGRRKNYYGSGEDALLMSWRR